MKYRAFLTPAETQRLAAIEAEKRALQQALRDLRKPYMDLFTKGRDRARKVEGAA